MCKIPILIPIRAFPRKNPVRPCECENRSHDLTFKTGLVFWNAAVGALVNEGDILAAYEVEKKTFDILAPFAGTLEEICLPDGSQAGRGTILGYIQVLS